MQLIRAEEIVALSRRCMNAVKTASIISDDNASYATNGVRHNGCKMTWSKTIKRRFLKHEYVVCLDIAVSDAAATP